MVFLNTYSLLRLHFFVLISVLLLTSSCLKSDFNITNRLSVYFEASNIDNDLAYANNDTLRITEIKFIVNEMKIETEDSTVLGTTSDASGILVAYNSENNGLRLVLSIDLGFSDLAAFNAYYIGVSPVPFRSPGFDDDFFGTGTTNYSLVIKGAINNKSFILRSNTVFEKEYSFSPVQLDDETETLRVVQRLDLKKVFEGEAGELLNPDEDESNEKILQNFRNNLIVSASAVNEF